MRFFITYLLTLLMGLAIAFGIGFVVRLWFPTAGLVLFVLIALWWLWVGTKYAIWRDRMDRMNRP